MSIYKIGFPSLFGFVTREGMRLKYAAGYEARVRPWRKAQMLNIKGLERDGKNLPLDWRLG